MGGIALRRRPHRALLDLGFLSFLCILSFSPSDTSACSCYVYVPPLYRLLETLGMFKNYTCIYQLALLVSV